MDKIKEFFSLRSPVKTAFVVVLGLFVVAFAVWIIGFSFRSLVNPSSLSKQIAPSYMMDSDYGYGNISEQGVSDGRAELSVRNVVGAIQPSYIGGTVGSDAEAFEATDYSGRYETAKLSFVCAEIEVLKGHSYVVFENVVRSDKNCSYTFKVKKEWEKEILTVLENLDPKYLTQNTYTIKQALEDFTSAEEILKKKLQSIEETLEEAQSSYDQLRVLATSARDAESLAKVIESKIKLIERLSLERLSLRSELDRLSRDKALQLDRLEYSYFNLSVYEKRIVDLEAIRDSWISEMQRFTREFNQFLQALTLGVLKLALYLILAGVYVAILILIAKYGWRGAKKLWKL